MSRTISASMSDDLAQMSSSVRSMVVTGRPLIDWTSSPRSQCRTSRPARDASLSCGGSATWIGFMGWTSRRCIHAAVLPMKTADDGSARWQALINPHMSSLAVLRRYSLEPTRSHDFPRSALNETPAVRASSSVKDRAVSSGGIFALRPTRSGSRRAALLPSQPINSARFREMVRNRDLDSARFRVLVRNPVRGGPANQAASIFGFAFGSSANFSTSSTRLARWNVIASRTVSGTSSMSFSFRFGRITSFNPMR